MLDTFTLKLSVLLSSGTNPCLFELQSTAVSGQVYLSTGVAHTLYSPPLLGVSLYGMSWTVVALWSTSRPVRCGAPHAGLVVTRAVMIPPFTWKRRQAAISVESRVFPGGSVT